MVRKKEQSLTKRDATIVDSAGMTAVDYGKRIAWMSETGLANRGNVTFTKIDDPEKNNLVSNKTNVRLAVSFDVPPPVRILFSTRFVGSFVENTLLDDLKRFRAAVLRDIRQRDRDNLPPLRQVAPAVEKAMLTLQAVAEAS